MKKKDEFRSVFKYLFPMLTLGMFIIAFAVMFDTFGLTLENALYNIILATIIFALSLIIFRRFHIASSVSIFVIFLLLYFDQYIFASRLTHLRYTDLRLLHQAIRVASRYPLIWNGDLTCSILFSIFISVMLIFVYRYYNLSYSKIVVGFIGSILLIVLVIILLSDIIPADFDNFDFTTATEERGLLYSWYCQAHASGLSKPEDYTYERAESILSEFHETGGKNDVNVIVIMNESLADYSLLGTPHFEDPLPYIHSLVDSGEAFEGKLAVSVFGGGTATTEYEFLTGNSAAFLPEGASPYLQYVNGRTENLTSEMKGLGYSTIAIHPYYSEEWNRSQVYNCFCFDRFFSGEDFGNTVITNGENATAKLSSENVISFGDGPQYVRGLISDQTSFDRVLQENGDKSFIFNVTIQNHGGYDYKGDDFTSKEYVTKDSRKEWGGKRTLNSIIYGAADGEVEDEVAKVNQYLTCANLSDQAFKDLIEELEKSDQKTVVLMFGDHQPGVLISEHYVDVEEGIDPDYTVPYILWANYDIEFDAPEILSPNYLSAVLKKNAGVGLTAWDQFRLEMMEQYPVVSTWFVLDKDGDAVNKDEIQDYSCVQYMRMFS